VPPTPPLADFHCLAAKLHHVEGEDLSPRPHVSMCCCLVSTLEHASCSGCIGQYEPIGFGKCTCNNCPAVLSLQSSQYCPHQTYHPNHLDCYIMIACKQASERSSPTLMIPDCYMPPSSSAQHQSKKYTSFRSTVSRANSPGVAAAAGPGSATCPGFANNTRSIIFHLLSGTISASLSAAT
jgi:hypothetical protein